MSTRQPSPFGTLLLHYRTAAQLSQEQLAARAGLSPDAVAALERGKRRIPRAVTVERLAQALRLNEADHAAFIEAAEGRDALLHGNANGDAKDAQTEATRSKWHVATQPTPLVDRVSELDMILHLLANADVHLLTLTGPAGVGKTRLALEVASRLTQATDGLPGNIMLVDLTPLRDWQLVLPTIAVRLASQTRVRAPHWHA